VALNILIISLLGVGVAISRGRTERPRQRYKRRWTLNIVVTLAALIAMFVLGKRGSDLGEQLVVVGLALFILGQIVVGPSQRT